MRKAAFLQGSFAAVLAVGILRSGLVTSSAQSLQTIAMTGDPAPDGDGTLGTLELPVLSDDGWVAFQARTSGQTNTFRPEVLLVWNGSNFVQVVRGSFEDPISFNVPALNNQRQMAISGTTDIFTQQPGPLRSETNGVAHFSQVGDVDPDGLGVFEGFGRVSLNDSGVGAFPGRVKIDDFNSSGGVYLSDTTNVASYAGEGDSPVGSTNQFVAFGDPIALNNSNQVAFLAGTTGDSGVPGRGVYLANGVSIETIAHAGDAAPGGGVFDEFLAPVLNSAGQLAFHAERQGVGGGPQGIYLADTSAVIVIAIEGQLAPNGGSFQAFTQPVLNDDGYVAFKGFTTAGDGIFLGTTNSMTALVVDNDPAPDGDGLFGFPSTITGIPVLNNQRQVAFLANFGTIGVSDTGIVFVDADSSKHMVARGGQALGGSTIAELDLLGDAVLEQDFGGRKALNDQGQVVFHAKLEDGREGVFLWSPPGPVAPRISLVAFDGNDVVVTMPSKVGEAYQLERRDNAGSGTWMNEGSAVAGTGGEIELRHAGGASSIRQFYRAEITE